MPMSRSSMEMAMPHVLVACFPQCPMSNSRKAMFNAECKKCSRRPVDFRGLGPYFKRGKCCICVIGALDGRGGGGVLIRMS